MKKNTCSSILILVFIALSLLRTEYTYSQTPGDIFNTSNLGASNPMNPNDDDFITASGGVFVGTDEQAEFELPFITILKLQTQSSGDIDGSSCCNRNLISGNVPVTLQWQVKHI